MHESPPEELNEKSPWEAGISIGANQMLRKSRLANKIPTFRAVQLMIASSWYPLFSNDNVYIKNKDQADSQAREYHNVAVMESGNKVYISCHYVDSLKEDYQLRCSLAMLTMQSVFVL